MTGLQPFNLFAPKRQSDGRRQEELQKSESGQGSPLTSGDTLSKFISEILAVWFVSGFVFTLSQLNFPDFLHYSWGKECEGELLGWKRGACDLPFTGEMWDHTNFFVSFKLENGLKSNLCHSF